MAKQCMYCGQILAKDDARFCNDCGRSQGPPSTSAAAPAPIKVKLPPKEFTRLDPPSVQQESDLPQWPPAPPAGGTRPLQREQPSRLSKRPVRLTAQEPPVRVENLETREHYSSASSSVADLEQAERSRPSPVEEPSTMVLPGWQEELEHLRKERPRTSSPVAPPKQPDPPIQSAPVAPKQSQSPSLQPRETPGSQAHAREDAPAKADPPPRPAEDSAHATEPLRRELRVKVWEQEPTIQYPQVRVEKQEAGPAPAVEHTPFAGVSFGPDEQSVQLADLETVHWQSVPDSPPAGKGRVEGERGEAIEAADSRSEEFAQDQNRVEDQPTLPLAMPGSGKQRPQVTIERASTPAPKDWASAKGEGVEDLPTRPMAASSAAPRSPMNNPQEPRPAAASAVPNSPSLPGIYNPAFADQPVVAAAPSQTAFDPLASGGRAANPNSLPGQVFDPTSLPPAPRNPVSLPGNAMLRLEEQSTQLRPPATPSDPFTRRPASIAPISPLPTTPRPEAASGRLKKTRRKKKRGHPVRVTLLVLLALLLVGGGSFVAYYQFTSAPPSTFPTQAYQNSAFDISLSYPQYWVVHVDQAHSIIHFVDSSKTGQINLSMTNATGQLSQYLDQEASQLGIAGLKTEPAITFAGSSWQQVQGTITEQGVTYTITLYVTQHSTHFYALACMAPPPVYTQMERVNFAPLRATFSFL